MNRRVGKTHSAPQKIYFYIGEKMFLDYLEQLVSIDTQSSLSNLALINYCQKIFETNGYEVRIWGNNGKANLFAYQPGYGQKIVLAAHSDTVPPASGWKGNPYQLRICGDTATGLGVSDMKTFIAIMLCFAASNMQKNLAFLLTYNEESDFEGAYSVTRKIVGKSDILIIGEPTENKVYCDAKGLLVYELTFIGKGGHGSEPDKGVSSIAAASKFICALEQLFPKIARQYQNDLFANPFSTINVGLISGGEAKNIIPEKTKVDFEVRTTAAQFEQEFDKLLDGISKKSPCKVQLKKSLVLPLFSASAKIRQKINQSLLAKGPSYCTEANILSKICPSTIIFGPGSIDQAHKADESISLVGAMNYQKSLTELINLL